MRYSDAKGHLFPLGNRIWENRCSYWIMYLISMPFQDFKSLQELHIVLLKLGFVFLLAYVLPFCSNIFIFLSSCPHFFILSLFLSLLILKVLPPMCLKASNLPLFPQCQQVYFLFCKPALPPCLLTVWHLMLEGRTFKNESAGTWGCPQFLALLSGRYKFGSNLGVLAHRLVETRCVRGDLLAPWGRGWSEIFAFVSLPSHCHLQHAPIFSSYIILCKIKYLNVQQRRSKINIWAAGVFFFFPFYFPFSFFFGIFVFGI